MSAFTEFGGRGRDIAQKNVIHIFSRCEGDLAPTSATQSIFAMLYGTFVYKSDLLHWLASPSWAKIMSYPEQMASK